jgi:hypothetical protein
MERRWRFKWRFRGRRRARGGQPWWVDFGLGGVAVGRQAAFAGIFAFVLASGLVELRPAQAEQFSLYRGQRDYRLNKEIVLRGYVWGSTITTPSMRTSQGVAALNARYDLDGGTTVQLGAGIASARLEIDGAVADMAFYPAFVTGVGTELREGRRIDATLLMQAAEIPEASPLPSYQCMLLVDLDLFD